MRALLVSEEGRPGRALATRACLAGLLGRRGGADGLLTHLIGCHWGLRALTQRLDRVLEILEGVEGTMAFPTSLVDTLDTPVERSFSSTCWARMAS